MTDEQTIAAIIQREGGYTNDPADAGGPTCWGITQSALAAWRGMDVTPAEVESLTKEEAALIYRERYLVQPGIARIANDDVRAAVLDAAVNHGPEQAIQLLQRALHLTEDGIIGNMTLAALPHLDGQRLARLFLAERMLLYGKIVTAKPDQVRFLNGWLNRVADQLRSVA